jgi:hypothetical protein
MRTGKRRSRHSQQGAQQKKRAIPYTEMNNQIHTGYAQAEIDWYRKHGKYADRIVKDSHGKQYMIGDWAWNRARHNRQEWFEPAFRGS